MHNMMSNGKQLSEHARCKHCGHAAYAHIITQTADGDVSMTTAAPGEGDCFCGCITFEARTKNPEAGRDWIVQVEFFLKNKWVRGEAKVRAMGQIGAIAKGVREVKRDLVKPRAHVSQIKITLIPIRKPKGGS